MTALVKGQTSDAPGNDLEPAICSRSLRCPSDRARSGTRIRRRGHFAYLLSNELVCSYSLSTVAKVLSACAAIRLDWSSNAANGLQTTEA